MADAAAILRANGLGLVDELIRAAQLENVALPIAATIIAGESWGKNIWGADGGLNVRTNGTYKPRTPVTQANYLAYRSEMRAGRIIRQGCGPAQCTSAQYQDTADALGGCWDPVANMRSGFRGMGALMRQYGTRNGARRYNGSGTQAERYADNFMARLEIWQSRLNGAAVGVAAPSARPSGGGGAAFRAEYGQVGAHVWRLASFLNTHFPAYAKIDLDRDPNRQRYGNQTVAAVREFAHRSGIPEADGENVGQKVAAALARLGFGG